MLVAALGQFPVPFCLVQVGNDEFVELFLKAAMTVLEFLLDGRLDEHAHVLRTQLGIFVLDVSEMPQQIV